jgi:tight adherence protein B
MEVFVFPILVALCVGMLAWGLFQVFGGLSDEKKRLQKRLSGENQPDEMDISDFTVVRRQQDIQGVSGTFARVPFLREIARRIAQVWPNFSLAKFVFLSLGLGIMGFTLLTLVTFSPVLGLLGLLIGLAPNFVLSNRINKRQRTFMDQLPDALDFLSRILKSGHSFSTGLQMMGTELPEPMAGEFRRVYDQHSLGQPLEDSLKDAAVRIDVSDFGFFVTAVLIQRQTGGDLSEVLTNISGMIRSRIRLAQHVKAKTAEGRFTGYILTGFPVVMFIISYVCSPSYAGVLLHTNKGLMLLGVAFGLCCLGLFCIRKITLVKV